MPSASLRRKDASPSGPPSGQDESRAGAPLPAWRCPAATVGFLLLVAASTAADLVTKHAVFDWLIPVPKQTHALIPDVLHLTLSTNPGIVFGLRVPGSLVLIATAAAAGTVVVLFATSSHRAGWTHAALAMVMGGSLGNAYDRVFGRVRFPGEAADRVGQVRDFIDFRAIHYPIFNVADILLVVGVALILLHLLRRPHGLGRDATP